MKPIRTLLLALVTLFLAAPSMRADLVGQEEIQQFLNGKTVATATAASLAAAVKEAVALSLSGTGLSTPADLAASALQPDVNNRVRADRNTTAGLIASTVVTGLITGTDSSFAADAAAVTISIVTVNSGLAAELTTTGQAAAVKDALGAISDAAFTTQLGNASTLLAADTAIGTALASNSALEALPRNGLLAILETGIAGITGVSGLSPLSAPQAAGDFVAGILSSGTAPDGLSLPVFAEDVLLRVGANTSVDEQVAYEVGIAMNGIALNTLATDLYAKYPAAAIKVTQGILDSVPLASGTNVASDEATRVNVVTSVTAGAPRDAVAILAGAVYTNPYFADGFTSAVLNEISTADHPALATDAASAALNVGEILGADGNELTNVAGAYDTLIASNTLAPASAGVLAVDLINGAVKSTVPLSAFTGAAAGAGGGKLVIGAGLITAATVTDLSGILDEFADGIFQNPDILPTAVAADIATLAGDVIGLVKSETFVLGDNPNEPVAEYLAGTLAKFVQVLAPLSDQFAIINAIEARVDLVVGKSFASVVNAAVFDAENDPSTQYTPQGVISEPETPVTNL